LIKGPSKKLTTAQLQMQFNPILMAKVETKLHKQ